jgi:acyl-CoA hydrolase
MPAAIPMDRHGYFNFSTSCSFSRAMCDKAKHIILEANANLPRCLGGKEKAVHVSEVDSIVEAEWPSR